MYIILYRKEKMNGEKKKSVVIKKWHCTICTICTLIRESAESAKSAKQKNTIFIQAAKSEEDFLICPKLPKMIQKFCYLSQKTQRKQNCTYIKMHVRLWDFGTLKSHSLKVSMQIFTIFSAHGMGILQPHPWWSPIWKGVENC